MTKGLSSSTTRPVASQIRIIRIISLLEIFAAIVVIVSQTVAIGASYDYATRSLTGIWTSWFFLIAASLALFWSSRCTFQGLLSVLVLQIIAGAMAVPLFVSCCLLLAVYDFQYANENETDNPKVGSSITILATNLIMIVASIFLMLFNAYNAYQSWIIAYGSQKEAYDQGSKSEQSEEDNADQGSEVEAPEEQDVKADEANEVLPNLSSKDILVIKFAGILGLVLALVIFCCQVSMFVLANSNGISIGIGIWGALYYAAAGLVALYTGYRLTSQSIVATFVLQVVQFILTVPLVAIAYYIVAIFGSCHQHMPRPECGKDDGATGLAVSVVGGIMAVSGMAQGMMSLLLILICLQAVCGVRCMIAGATVYPSSA